MKQRYFRDSVTYPKWVQYFTPHVEVSLTSRICRTHQELKRYSKLSQYSFDMKTVTS